MIPTILLAISYVVLCEIHQYHKRQRDAVNKRLDDVIAQGQNINPYRGDTIHPTILAELAGERWDG